MLAHFTAAARSVAGWGRDPSDSSAAAASMATAVLAGLVGHKVEDYGAWLPKMSFRAGARDVTPEELLSRFGARRGERRPIDVAILIHGLFTDEQNWTLGPNPLAPRLEPLFGWSPLLVRYNAGRHISENGEDLARLLVQLRDAWGPRLGRIQLFGHSMGGLVARSTLWQLEKRNEPVLGHVDRLFLLATPNHGADLERLGHLVEIALLRASRLPKHSLQLLRREARKTPGQGAANLADEWLGLVFQTVVERAGATATLPVRSAHALVALRSDGIRDVRFGYMQREEWELDGPFSDRVLVNHRRPLPPPAGVKAYAIAGSLWPTAGATPSRVRNDGLVCCRSAAGLGEGGDDLGAYSAGRYAELPFLLHQLLPTSRRVRRRIRSWVESE